MLNEMNGRPAKVTIAPARTETLEWMSTKAEEIPRSVSMTVRSLRQPWYRRWF